MIKIKLLFLPFLIAGAMQTPMIYAKEQDKVANKARKKKSQEKKVDKNNHQKRVISIGLLALTGFALYFGVSGSDDSSALAKIEAYKAFLQDGGKVKKDFEGRVLIYGDGEQLVKYVEDKTGQKGFKNWRTWNLEKDAVAMGMIVDILTKEKMDIGKKGSHGSVIGCEIVHGIVDSSKEPYSAAGLGFLTCQLFFLLEDVLGDADKVKALLELENNLFLNETIKRHYFSKEETSSNLIPLIQALLSRVTPTSDIIAEAAKGKTRGTGMKPYEDKLKIENQGSSDQPKWTIQAIAT